MSSNTTSSSDLSALNESANVLAGSAWLLLLATGVFAILPAVKTVVSGTRVQGIYDRLYNVLRASSRKRGVVTLTTAPLASSGFALLVWRMQWMHLATLVGTLFSMCSS